MNINHFIVQFFIEGMKAVCYSATQNRKEETYITLFKALKHAASVLGINLSPSLHMIDFETAAAIASKKIFVNTEITFCHFHFAKAIWRGIKKKSTLNQLHLLVYRQNTIVTLFKIWSLLYDKIISKDLLLI